MRRQSRQDMGPLRPPQGQGCDHPACREAGLYRAPKARDRLSDYFWFCLEHVRDYNRAWNYYEGMEEAEIEAHIRRDTVWQRPTWPLGRWGSASRGAQAEIHDPFGFFADEAARAEHERETRRRQPQTAEEKALALLDLRPGVTWEAIKARYKQLAKKLHPDANGGDKAAEELLKVINQAYSTLKNSALS